MMRFDELKIIPVLAAFLIWSGDLISQYSVRDTSIFNLGIDSRADELYSKMAYQLAIDEYLSYDSLGTVDILNVANAYRMIHDTQKAELWYEKVISEDILPKHILHYAQVLQSNGKDDLAASYYSKYSNAVKDDQSWDQISHYLAENLDSRKIAVHNDVKMKNVSEINSERLDYSPTYIDDGILFVSSRRPTFAISVEKDPWMEENFMSLFYAKTNSEGGLLSPKSFSRKLTSSYHEGPSSYSNSDEVLYFSRNHLKGKKKLVNSDGITRMQLYSAKRENGEWTEISELAFNKDKYDYCHPAISSDGLKLYFSSNMKGGYGGMDLYVVRYDGVNWSKPKNLGKSINTAGNEVFPFMYQDGTLFFSSNGRDGAGGLDIYSVSMSDENEDESPINIGKPFNSSKDDFGFILNREGKSGYLSSSRSGGKGKDDIYAFDIGQILDTEGEVEIRNMEFCIHDSQSNNALSNVQLELIPVNGSYVSESDDELKIVPKYGDEGEVELFVKKAKADGAITVTTDQNGYFTFPAELEGNYKMKTIVGDKEYHGKLFPLSSTTLFKEDDRRCIPMVAEVRVVEDVKKRASAGGLGLNILVNNKKYGKSIPNVAVTMIDYCTGEEHEYLTNANGYVIIDDVDCGCDFALKANKKHFSNGIADVSTLNDNCNTAGMKEVVIDMEPLLSRSNVVEVSKPTVSSPAKPSVVSAPLPYTEDVALIEKRDLVKGRRMILKNIYYDYNKSYINSGARKELRKVVQLMNRYPGLIIDLTSHTDIRGDDDYNKVLSNRRAKAAMKYIVSKGIAASRITSQGYGETMLIEDCGNNCSEEEHQLNRRTEIVVIGFEGF